MNAADIKRAEARQLALESFGYRASGLDLIAPPGKFEGEPYYVPTFYEAMLNGAETQTLYDNGTPIAVFDVDAEDREAYRFDHDTVAVALWETDTGFAMFAEWDARQLEAAAEADAEEFAGNDEDFDEVAE